jgi:hypothetical protein
MFLALASSRLGAIAQLGERVLCKHEVVGSIPSGSTRWSIAATQAQRFVLEKFCVTPRGRDACCLSS